MSFIPGANVGPYRIVEQAERNGVATTYTAYQPSLGRYVAVVVVPELIFRGWRRLLHNQRALYVKRLLLVEPNVILASVPYQLIR